MGSTKKEQYSQLQLELARTAKAIGHPARVTILQCLAQNGVANNQQFAKITKLSEATVCFHLQILEINGLITERFFKNQHIYQLTTHAKNMVNSLDQIIS